MMPVEPIAPAFMKPKRTWTSPERKTDPKTNPRKQQPKKQSQFRYNAPAQQDTLHGRGNDKFHFRNPGPASHAFEYQREPILQAPPPPSFTPDINMYQQQSEDVAGFLIKNMIMRDPTLNTENEKYQMQLLKVLKGVIWKRIREDLKHQENYSVQDRMELYRNFYPVHTDFSLSQLIIKQLRMKMQQCSNPNMMPSIIANLINDVYMKTQLGSHGSQEVTSTGLQNPRFGHM